MKRTGLNVTAFTCFFFFFSVRQLFFCNVFVGIVLQLTDYAIARSIVNLHSRNDNSAPQRAYSAEEIRQYIMFCRMLKPKMTKVSSLLQSVSFQSSLTLLTFELVKKFRKQLLGGSLKRKLTPLFKINENLNCKHS